MLTERQVIGKIEVLEDGQIQVRADTVIERDGVEVIRTFHRRVLEPGDPLPSGVDPRVAAIAAVVWTADTIRVFRERRATQPRPGRP